MASTVRLNEEWQRNSLELKDINSLIFSFMYIDNGFILFLLNVEVNYKK